MTNMKEYQSSVSLNRGRLNNTIPLTIQEHLEPIQNNNKHKSKPLSKCSWSKGRERRKRGWSKTTSKAASVVQGRMRGQSRWRRTASMFTRRHRTWIFTNEIVEYKWATVKVGLRAWAQRARNPWKLRRKGKGQSLQAKRGANKDRKVLQEHVRLWNMSG